MNQATLFSLIAGCLFLIFGVIFKFVPNILRNGLEKFKAGFLLEYFISGIYCLTIAVIAYLAKFDDQFTIELVVIGIFGFGFIIMLPTFILMLIKQTKDKTDQDHLIK